VNCLFQCPAELAAFIMPMLGLPAWGVKQGYGSFLTFEFGEPRLEVHEMRSPENRLRRSAHVHGEWHLWIYCCHWRVSLDGSQLAQSEDDSPTIDQAAQALNAQKLVAVNIAPENGRSLFTFDLGGVLETWPYGEDANAEQWKIVAEPTSFAFRADGQYWCGLSNLPADQVPWVPFR
jgi:hypothetical protein